MRTKWWGLMLTVALANVLPVWATVLPDACGADSVRFKVSNQKGQLAPGGPAADKAQIVIVENPELDPQCAPHLSCNCSHWHGWVMGGSQPRQVALGFFGSPWGASFVRELAVGYRITEQAGWHGVFYCGAGQSVLLRGQACDATHG